MSERRINPDTGVIEESSWWGLVWLPVDFDDE
jgi:hypothetical protein